MKKFLAILSAVLLLILSSCSNQVSQTNNSTDPDILTDKIESIQEKEETESSYKAKETVLPETEMSTINLMEKLTDIDGVISVTKQSFSNQINGALAYKVLYETQNGKLSADVVLPKDYHLTNKNYTVIIYFPQLNITIEELASKYALKISS